MSVTTANEDAIPDGVAAVLDQHVSHELLKAVTVGQSAYYLVSQSGENEGNLVVIRQTPGAAPEVVAADTALAGLDTLPREVVAALEAIFGEPASETAAAEKALHGPEALSALAATATREQIRRRLFNEAHQLDGHLSSRDVPGTQHGEVACAWAVNEVARRGVGRPIGGNLSVDAMRKVLVDRHFPITEAQAVEGTIILSPNAGSISGHVGIVGGSTSSGRRVYSNSSLRALWTHYYTVDSWKAYFRGQKGLRVEFFELNPSQFTGGTPPYPGTPLQQGSRGGDVRTVQQRLNELGNRLETDGIFGPATHQAVVAFQKKVHLTADGIVGPKTWAALWG